MKLIDWFKSKNKLIVENNIIKKSKKNVEEKYSLLFEKYSEISNKYINLLEEKSQQFDLYIKYQKLCEELSKDKKELKKQLAETQEECNSLITIKDELNKKNN